MPMPELTREEFNPYRKTQLQFHLYEFIFHEADTELGIEGGVPRSDLFKAELEYLSDIAPILIKECKESEHLQLFFDLRWYNAKGLKVLSKKASNNYTDPNNPLLINPLASMAPTNYTTWKGSSDPQIYELTLLKQVSEVKSQCNPTLVRMLIAIFETLKYYCKLTRNQILNDHTSDEIVNEYCKRVFF